MTSRSPARWLAPLALLAALVAVLALVSSTLGGGGEGGAGGESAEPAAEETRTEERESDGAGEAGEATGTSSTTAQESGPRTYTVEPGDTLGAIAEETGVPIERLQELNPEVDSQALSVGQTLRLRGGG